MVTSIPFLRAKITDENDFSRLKELAKSQEDWTLDYRKNDIKIWSKSLPETNIKMVKVWSVFSGVSSKDLFYTLMDPIYRKEWDAHMVVGYEIGYLNHNNAVIYYGASCPPLKKRDFVLQKSWLDTGSEYFVINHSICHKTHPPRPGFVRAISYFSGYLIKSQPNGSEVCFVSQTDPQGIVPSWIVNKCTTIFAPRIVRVLEKAASEYAAWKSQNSPNYVPWVHPEQIKSSKISIADCVPSEEEKESSFYRYLEQRTVKRRNSRIHIAENLTEHLRSNNPIGESSRIFSIHRTPNPSYQSIKGTDKKDIKKKGHQKKR